MKTRLPELVVPLLALCILAGGAARVQSQVTVTVDPSQNWLGYMAVTDLAADGGNFDFAQAWGTSALQANFSGTTNLILAPCTNVWNPADAYWVKPDGVTPNKMMDASFYVQNDALVNTNLTFNGVCLGSSLLVNPEPLTGVTYTSVAFVKTFDAVYNLIGDTYSILDVNFPDFSITVNTTGAAHVQYGFETVGPDASPATVASLGTVVIASALVGTPPPAPTNNAPTPSHPPANVLAMYNSSGTYTDHSPERWLAGWSSAGETTYTIPATGRNVLKYPNLQYAGVEFYDTNNGDNVGGSTDYSINASAYDTFHVDLWTPNANQFGIQLVSLNPTTAPQVDYLPASGKITTNGWVSLDIPLSTFTGLQPGLVLSHLQQLLWIDNEGGGGITSGTFYIDNVYFYNSGSVARPTISASLSGGSIQLTFPTQNGSSYDVQFKTNVTDAVWQTLITVPGNGSSHMVPDPAGQKSRFYRLYVH